jgi:hypothetical protein
MDLVHFMLEDAFRQVQQEFLTADRLVEVVARD